MGSNICGNCGNFKLRPGERFFNCTSAEQAGIKYAMQVRADTRSCDAFVPFGVSMSASAAPAPMPPRKRAASGGRPLREERLPSGERQRPTGLCPRGRTLLVLSLVIAVLLLSWLVYTCASTLVTTPEPTPTPRPTAPGPKRTPPRPTLIYSDAKVGQWVDTPQLACIIYSPQKRKVISHVAGSYPADPGTTFVSVGATVTNLSNTYYIVEPGDFTLTDSKGNHYRQYTYEFHYSLFPHTSLSVGGSVSGELLWKVPDFARGLTISFPVDPVSYPRVTARWKLPW